MLNSGLLFLVHGESTLMPYGNYGGLSFVEDINARVKERIKVGR